MLINPTGDDPPRLRVLALLRKAIRHSQALLDGRPSGRRWRRPADTHPGWCAQDHTCTVRRDIRGPLAEHRSPVATWRRSWGCIVATRVQGVDGPARLELRTQVRLSDRSDAVALEQGVQVPLVVEAAISAALVELEADGLGLTPRLELRRAS